MQSGAPANRPAEAGIRRQRSAETSDDLAVVLVLVQSHFVVGGLDAGRDHQFRQRMPFVFGEGLKRLRDEMLVEVRKRRVQLRDRIGWILIAVGVGPVVPGASAEHAPLRFLAYNRGVAGVPVAVQLVHAAGLWPKPRFTVAPF